MASTLGRWISYCSISAGLDGKFFSDHSTRSARTSKAAALGVAIESFLHWSSETTFTLFYRRTVVSNPIQEATFLKRRRSF